MLSSLAPGTSIADMKSGVLSAFKADVALDALDFMATEPPQISVESEDDFELCRALKERGKPTGAFEVLEPSKVLKDSGLGGWEAIFLQVRDRSSGEHISFWPAVQTPCLWNMFHCSAFVNITYEAVGLYEPHALNLQANFYQSHTPFHQCMTNNHRKRRTRAIRRPNGGRPHTDTLALFLSFLLSAGHH